MSQYDVRLGAEEKKRGRYALWRLSKRQLGALLRTGKLRWRRVRGDTREAKLGQFHPTAVARQKPPTPLREAVESFGACDRALYHGVGRDVPGARLLQAQCGEVAVYDPYHPNPKVTQRPRGTYDEIVSVYTLNVVDQKEGKRVLKEIHRALKPGGHATIAVRRDF